MNNKLNKLQTLILDAARMGIYIRTVSLTSFKDDSETKIAEITTATGTVNIVGKPGTPPPNETFECVENNDE